MKIICVLSHLMSQDCMLGEETLARANLAIDTFKTGEYAFIVTSGWAYRDDCDTPIGDVVANYIAASSNIEANKIVSDTNSRDTVGDAYFLRKRLEGSDCSELVVVTSDYHLERTRYIFEKVFCYLQTIVVIGADTRHKNRAETMAHEKSSIKAFDETFANTNFARLIDIREALRTKHPFYNGKIYCKLQD